VIEKFKAMIPPNQQGDSFEGLVAALASQPAGSYAVTSEGGNNYTALPLSGAALPLRLSAKKGNGTTTFQVGQ
jgi:hypothetical protein